MNIIKTILFSLSIGTILLLLTGCPYDSEIGLNSYEESLKLEKKFYGDWTCFNMDGSREEIQIGKGMKNVYNIRHNAFDENNKKEDYKYYRGFMTIIKDVEILNLEKKDGNFNFYKYKLVDPDELKVFAIGEEYVKANYYKAEKPDVKSLRAFIDSNLYEENLFEEPMQFFRDGSGKFKKHK